MTNAPGRAAHIHTHAIRLPSGDEVLVTRVLAGDGKVGYGYTLTLDATASRHMAEWHAGLREDVPEALKLALPPEIEALLPWIRWLP
jgi:hypothetical protein